MITPTVVPMIVNGEEKEGSVFPRVNACFACRKKPCKDSKSRGRIEVCEFGVCFVPVSNEILLYGFLASDWQPTSTIGSDRRKAFERNRNALREDQRPNASLVLRVASIYSESIAKAQLASTLARREREQKETLEQLSSVSQEIVVAQLQKNLRGMSSALIHDLLQLLATIYQNIDYVLCERYGAVRAFGQDYPGAANSPKVTPSDFWRKEKAIYYAAELMTARLQVARLVTTENFVEDGVIWFSPHRLLTKFVRIYQSVASERKLDFEIWEDWHECRVPKRMSEVALLNVVDNAVKYAPVGSKIRFSFECQEGEWLKVACESLGPPLLPSEEESIFLPSTRGKNAERLVKAGNGIGLWQARAALGRHGEISVQQDSNSNKQNPNYRLTAFVIRYFHVRQQRSDTGKRSG